MNQLKMIEELCNAYGAPGFEDDVLLLGRKYGADLAEIKEDSLRDLYFYRNENTGNKPVVLLDGHSDECAFMAGLLVTFPLIKFSSATTKANGSPVSLLQNQFTS